MRGGGRVFFLFLIILLVLKSQFFFSSDGGSKILNYVVERKDVSRDNWIVASSFIKECTFTVQGLNEGSEYEV